MYSQNCKARTLSLFLLPRRRISVRATYLTIAALSLLPFFPASAQTNIVIVPGAGLSANANALAAMNAAAAQWASFFSDPITITINADITATGGSSFGTTAPVTLQGGYDTIRNAIATDATASASSSDNIATALPSAAQFTANLPAGRSVSGNLQLTKADAKALGFGGLDSAFGVSDGSISFNSAFPYDFNRANGITPGSVDFQTVALREIGHILGFISVVDTIDTTSAAQLPSVSPTPLDLFRFGLGAGPHSTANFTAFARDLRPGVEAVFSDAISEQRLSTGAINGDGRAAGHWKDDALTGTFIGVMDPTVAAGTMADITAADLHVFDLLGYDLKAVPEPQITALCAMITVLWLVCSKQSVLKWCMGEDVRSKKRCSRQES